ncbi:MAG: YbhB/YbcL family Raf kinase inhibitor-like protein [Deltaproteobacteria bacterium]|nr:YbhB/YbcL family Raf kinase inhibitor-like protein [Deltaproteobacteria bacterium]
MQKALSYLIAVLILIYPLHVCAEMKGGREMKINVGSAAFTEGGMIPKQYTCDGADISPPLSWSTVPEGTKSITIVADDPDAPAGTWVHWIVYNLPPDLKGLPENVPAKETLANGGMQGMTDFRRIGYGGPCPPSGTHRYFFKVYALDKILDLYPGAIKKRLLNAMEGHILAEGELIGKYRRQ